MSALQFGRLITAMITPFDEELNLDLGRAEELADRLVEGGTDAIVACGTTGESPTVSTSDKVEVIRAIVSGAAGRIPVIANVGNNCTADTIEFAHAVQGTGASGFMCVVPYYNKPPQEGLYQHFHTIADAVELPIVLYNIPGRCSVNMTAETTLRLAHDCENIAAVKEASGDIEQIGRIIDERPDGFAVYSGDDAFTLTVMERGGDGVISTIGNVAPARMKEVVELCAQGAWDEAQAKNDALMPLMKGLFKTTNPILVKEALKLLGFPVGGVRLPLVDATPQQSEELAATMRAVGVL